MKYFLFSTLLFTGSTVRSDVIARPKSLIRRMLRFGIRNYCKTADRFFGGLPPSAGIPVQQSGHTRLPKRLGN
jgi:hypothetical protein